MSVHTMMKRGWALASVAAVGLAADGSSALAQNADGYGLNPSVNAGPEALYVYPTRHRSTIGAPIEDVFLQRQINYADLDLREQWGADELVQRVRTTARSLCWDLSFRFPASTPDDQTCYLRTMRKVMPQIDAAIARARGEYSGH